MTLPLDMAGCWRPAGYISRPAGDAGNLHIGIGAACRIEWLGCICDLLAHRRYDGRPKFLHFRAQCDEGIK